MTTQYPMTLRAVRKERTAPWDVVKALRAEVPTKPNGDAQHGALQDVALFLTKRGMGDKYNPSYLGDLFSLGRWLSSASSETSADLQDFPVRLVMVCRFQGGLSPKDALAKLQAPPEGGWTLRSLADSLGKPWADTQATPAQVVAAIKQDPKVAEAVAKDDDASKTVHKARVEELSRPLPEDPEKQDPDIQRRKREREAADPHEPGTDILYVVGALINANRHARHAIRLAKSRNSTGGYTEDERAEAHEHADAVRMTLELFEVVINDKAMDEGLQKLLSSIEKAED